MALILLDDLFVDMGISPAVSQRQMQQLGGEELAVYRIMAEQGEMTAEELGFAAELPIGKVHGILTVLEMKGLIFSAMGKFFVAKY